MVVVPEIQKMHLINYNYLYIYYHHFFRTTFFSPALILKYATTSASTSILTLPLGIGLPPTRSLAPAICSSVTTSGMSDRSMSSSRMVSMRCQSVSEFPKVFFLLIFRRFPHQNDAYLIVILGMAISTILPLSIPRVLSLLFGFYNSLVSLLWINNEIFFYFYQDSVSEYNFLPVFIFWRGIIPV